MEEAALFIREWENEAAALCNRVALSQWTYATNITEYNKKQMVNLKTNYKHFFRNLQFKANTIRFYSFVVLYHIFIKRKTNFV